VGVSLVQGRSGIMHGMDGAESLEVSVKRLGVEPWHIRISAAASVGDLRSSIRASLELPPEAPLAMCHRGKVLTDDAAGIRAAGVADHPHIIAVPVASDQVASRSPMRRLSPSSDAPLGSDAVSCQGGPSGLRSYAEGANHPLAEDGAADEPMCRICFDTTTTPYNRLITPCACSGTMRHVHAQCLAEWRMRAVGTLSFERCDQCRVPYKVRATRAAPWLQSPAMLHAVTILSVCLFTAASSLLPIPLERYFFSLTHWHPHAWLRTPAAARAIRGVCSTAAVGLAQHLSQLLRQDRSVRDACLRCIMLSVAANGPRIFRIFAVIGVFHYLTFTYFSVKMHMKRAMLQFGEILLAATDR